MKTMLAAAAVLTSALLASQAQAVTAIPTESFSFVGKCSDCAGVGIGTLTLQGYSPGQALASSNFVSFSYASNLISFQLNKGQQFSQYDFVSGSLGSAQGFYDVEVSGVDNNELVDDFTSSTDGTWSVTQSELTFDRGTDGTWNPGVSAAPEPSTWALMITGLGGIGLMLRRTRRTSAAATA